MKKIIGFAIALLGICFIGILILRIWDIEIVTISDLVNSGLTLLLLGILITVLIVVYGLFYKNASKGYDKSVGNRAHLKNN